MTNKNTVRETFLKALAKHNGGQMKEAEALYLSVLNQDADSAESYYNLGLIMLERGHHGAAVPYFRHAARLQPTLVDAHLRLANAFAKAGCHDAAEEALRLAASLGRQSAMPHFSLANLLVERGRLDEAEAAYREAIRIDPAHCDSHNNLGNLLRQQHRRDEALAMLSRALDIDPASARAYNNRGNVLRDLDRLEEAVADYREAVRLAPDFGLGHFNLGNAWRDLGRMQEAAASFRRAIDLNPSHADAYRHLVQVARVDPDDLLVKIMEDKVQDRRVSEADRMHFAFALGSVFDKNRDYEKAFAHFRTANSLKRKTFTYDPEDTAKLLRRIRRHISTAAMRTRAPADNPDDTPIFIVGMMRSGTTLIEQILASHPEVIGGGELPLVQSLVDARAARTNTPYPEFFEALQDTDFAAMGDEYISAVREKFGHGARFITDKMPQNFLYIGLIRLMLPRARVIHMHRAPLDTCLSIYTYLFTAHHPYAYDLREAGLYTRFCRDLMKHWNDVLGDRVHHQSYEDLIQDPETATRKLLAFCDLPFHEDCLAFHKTDRPVRTASGGQVRERLTGKSMNRWKNYRNHLGVLASMFEQEPA